MVAGILGFYPKFRIGRFKAGLCCLGWKTDLTGSSRSGLLLCNTAPNTSASRFGPDRRMVISSFEGIDRVEFYVGTRDRRLTLSHGALDVAGDALPARRRGWRFTLPMLFRKVRFVLTTALRSDSAIAEQVRQHRYSPRVVALWVDDARRAWQETVNRGAISVAEPKAVSDEHGELFYQYRTYGDTVHVC